MERRHRRNAKLRQVNNLLENESGILYHCTHVYRLLYKWGFKQKELRNGRKRLLKKGYLKIATVLLNSLHDVLLKYSLKNPSFSLMVYVERLGISKYKAHFVIITGSYEQPCFFCILVLMKASY